jgi:hypothetical protein
MRYSQSGYAAPLILIILLLVLAIPVYFFASSDSTPESENVRGASSSGNISDAGFSVLVTSESETWDLVEYLCEDLDSCIKGLDSGKRWGSVSGGKTDLHEVVVGYSNEWKGNEYIKYFVRSGWDVQKGSTGFEVVDVGEVPGSDIYSLSDGSSNYDVVIIPISSISKDFYTSAHFSD